MTYILVIWAVVAGNASPNYGWRPLGEFHYSSSADPQKLCHAAAAELGLKATNYRCVRSK
jgi:hypothetical protein